jgi:hypothetical protein
MVNTSNTIYHIQYDFTLGEDITVPANCVLEFDGGSISGNYTITFNGTIIDSELYRILPNSCRGSIKNSIIYPEWFSDTNSNMTSAINACVNLIKNGNSNITILLTKDVYRIEPGITIDASVTLKSEVHSKICIIEGQSDSFYLYHHLFYLFNSNIVIDGIVFDQLIENDKDLPIHSNVGGRDMQEYCICTYKCPYLTIKNCVFNFIGVNAVNIDCCYDTEVSTVYNNTFNFYRNTNTASPNYDVSALWFIGSYHEAYKNTINGNCAGSDFNMQGGIESHGWEGKINGNSIYNTNVGVNIVSLEDDKYDHPGMDNPIDDSKQRYFKDNYFVNCRDCFCFWPYYIQHDIQNILISNNIAEGVRTFVRCVIDLSGQVKVEDNVVTKVSKINNVQIKSNTVKGYFKAIDAYGPNVDSHSDAAISLLGYCDIDGFSIINNNFDGFPLHLVSTNFINSSVYNPTINIDFKNNICNNCFNSICSQPIGMNYTLFWLGQIGYISLLNNIFHTKITDRNNQMVIVSAYNETNKQGKERTLILKENTFVNNDLNEMYCPSYVNITTDIKNNPHRAFAKNPQIFTTEPTRMYLLDRYYNMNSCVHTITNGHKTATSFAVTPETKIKNIGENICSVTGLATTNNINYGDIIQCTYNSGTIYINIISIGVHELYGYIAYAPSSFTVETEYAVSSLAHRQWLLRNLTLVNSGASRPNYAAVSVGYCFFDTSLGKPIWVKSIASNVVTWVDATGTAV